LEVPTLFDNGKMENSRSLLLKKLSKEPSVGSTNKNEVERKDSNDQNQTIRKKSKKPQRRLSRISLGKNLMLSQTAELKMQWTIGK